MEKHQISKNGIEPSDVLGFFGLLSSYWRGGVAGWITWDLCRMLFFYIFASYEAEFTFSNLPHLCDTSPPGIVKLPPPVFGQLIPEITQNEQCNPDQWRR
jgi:hypothetical protein